MTCCCLYINEGGAMCVRLALLLVCLLCAFALAGDTSRSIPVVVTAYTHTGRPTASGLRPQVGMVALSRDLERTLQMHFGQTLELVGLGHFVFHDRMARRWTK